jgi:hypothetical protein
MSTPRLKSFARRGSMLTIAFAFVAAAIVPAASVFADALNPLTERSLLLSSSAPGYQDTDGSGNSTALPNAIGENHAPAGSGPNGMKTGQTFSFRVSTDSRDVGDGNGTGRAIEAFTLQYCTGAAGRCQAPGNNLGDAKTGSSTARETNAVAKPNSRADLDVNYGAFDEDDGTTNAVAGTDFKIFVGNTELSNYTGWEMLATNVESQDHTGALTGKRNFITLRTTDSATALKPAGEGQVRIVFVADEDQYITNPGSGAFFVKMNTYDSGDVADHVPAVAATENENIIDGGVTVANVMTDSIHITTKVLETMSFSVGNRNRDTQNLGAGNHGPCDVIEQIDNNRLNLGNPDQEYSLETTRAWDVYSYWRLSSNSSGGATVYYSGNTLENTVGDRIEPIGATSENSTPGSEQFGLAFDDAANDTFDKAFSNPTPDTGAGETLGLVETEPDRYFIPSLTRDQLAPLSDYAQGEGTITLNGTARFAFVAESNTLPEIIASNNQNVISCATAKMRYMANIGADTPAGVYTTKINYLAAPQY